VIRGLIFDLDGTLVDSLPGIASALNHSLEDLKLPTHSVAARKIGKAEPIPTPE